MDYTTLSRRGFVSAGLSTVALAADAKPTDAQPAPLSAEERAKQAAIAAVVPIVFDRAAFATILAKPYPHRQMMLSGSFANASNLGAMNSIRAYEDPNGFAAGPRSLHVAVVLLGSAHTIVFDDALYAKYPIGLMLDEEMRPDDTTFRAFWSGLQRNIVGDYTRELIAHDVDFFVCNNSFSSYVVRLARRLATSDAPLTRERVIALHDELASHFLPNTMLVPAGVAAANALQEAHYTYCP